MASRSPQGSQISLSKAKILFFYQKQKICTFLFGLEVEFYKRWHILPLLSAFFIPKKGLKHGARRKASFLRKGKNKNETIQRQNKTFAMDDTIIRKQRQEKEKG